MAPSRPYISIIPYDLKTLKNMMAAEPDFINEPNSLQVHAKQYTEKTNKTKQNISIVVTPKYHPEIAGKGIEYSWGMAKKKFRNIELVKKATKQQFHNSVRTSIEHVEVKHARKFSGRSRRYMMAYKNINKKELTYSIIEKFVKKEKKSHRSVEDDDLVFIDEEMKN